MVRIELSHVENQLVIETMKHDAPINMIASSRADARAGGTACARQIRAWREAMMEQALVQVDMDSQPSRFKAGDLPRTGPTILPNTLTENRAGADVVGAVMTQVSTPHPLSRICPAG